MGRGQMRAKFVAHLQGEGADACLELHAVNVGGLLKQGWVANCRGAHRAREGGLGSSGGACVLRGRSRGGGRS